MNKRFLLCTVSGILFCSYSSWSYASPEVAAVVPNVPSAQPTHGATEVKLTNLPEKAPESSASKTEGNGNSRKPSAPDASSPAPTTQDIPPRLSESPQSAPVQPALNVLQTLLRPSSAESADKGLSLEQLGPIQPVKSIRVEEEQPTIESEKGSTVTRHDIRMHNKVVIANAQNKNSIVKLIRGTASSDFIGLAVAENGSIEATNVTVAASIAGLTIKNGTVRLKDSTVIVTSDALAHGIVVRDAYDTSSTEGGDDPASPEVNSSNIMLENTKLLVEHGVGIDVYRSHPNTRVSLRNSEVRADVLLKSTKEEDAPANTFMLTADHSFLEGRVRTLEGNRTVFDLRNGTKWFLKANKNILNNDIDSPVYEQLGVDQKSYSNLSTLKLANSMVVFDKPAAGHYQTLFIGSDLQQENRTPDAPAVYSATGTTEIHLNSKWSSHSPVTEQETDRLVINGDVLGSTVVHINLLKKNKKITDSDSVWEERMASLPLETHGISVIQVSGKADKNSFKLAGNYMTMGGLPYKYVLTAYAPGTSHANQNLFGKNSRDFWDFRLQNAYIDKDRKIRALLPQVANYLVMPNSLFSTGYADVSNQNVLLDNIQATMFGTENNKKKGIFLSSYGERVTLSSNRDPLGYGYGADVNYNALQIGVVLGALEGKDINTYFGILGTYGKLAFTPKGMEDSEKTTFDKWSFTIYNGIQHSSGIYINTLLSYGTLKGDITTALIGNVAKLDGTGALSVSATVGKKLATATKGLTFEPQAQFIYQNLMFDVISDANNLEVDMGNSRQWLIRMGGRLTQTLNTVKEGNALSFYGKLNVIRAFGDDGTIKIADTFYLDSTGASIEGGVGVNAYLSRNIALHGDISYRQKLQKAGVSGTSFSGGIRYHF
ncbi:autotransporter outer membrane beta-barrel domain-containing protein [Bartonella taylorii]|uniref:autotransporter outer membrane beta-barrel domain-containing protein n=1 Tax=Bartonella taylorii TaxID=33046 RepID=UPI001ABB7BE7|nr:autotransporter outer membrane beta-barrel domain-containing protein [Bartonella taylorii]